jgi:hypothetical protein
MPSAKKAPSRRLGRQTGRFTQSLLAGLGAAGIVEIPILVLMNAPTVAYSITGVITTATISGLGYLRRRRGR